MKPEKPAQGILQHNSWGHSVMYQVACDCLETDHMHTIDVEADEHDVTVTIYAKATTPFWSKSRWQTIWRLLTRGYTEYEASIILKEQAAINYANTLTSAVNDVKLFRTKQDAARSKK